MCWSCEVVLLAIIPEGVSPLATTCTTSLIASILLGGCFFRRIIAAVKKHKKVLIRRVALLSVLNVSYNVLIEYGLDYLDVSMGAFTLSMTAVVLPVMLLISRRETNPRTWISALFVLSGIAIALIPTIQMPHLPGLAVMLSSCLVRAVFIIKLNDYAQEYESVSLAAGISIMNTVIAFVGWCFVQPMTFFALPWTPELLAILVVYGYFIVAFAAVINVYAQRHATAAHATIIYSTEIVYSLIWASCLPNSIMTPVEITWPIIGGCALVVLGNIIKIAPIDDDDLYVPGERGEEAAKIAARGTSAEVATAGEGATAAAAVLMEDAALSGDGAPSGDEALPAVAKPEPVRMSDLVTGLLERLPGKFLRCVALIVILLVVYMIIAMPFRAITIIPGFTDIRPVCMLEPVYGVFFGLPGCFAFAVGNLIGDIVSDSLRWSSIAGFIGNFVYPFILYLFWTQLRKKPFNLRTRGRAAGFALSVIVAACIQSALISVAVGYYYPEVDVLLFAASVVANGSIFPIAFATPFIILIQEELAFVPVERGRLLPGLVLGKKTR